MCGRATFTMVVSSTTISWAVRMTKRSREGFPRWRRSVPGGPPEGVVTAWGCGALRRLEGIDYDLSDGILVIGSFLRLLYGGSLRLANQFFREAMTDVA